MLINVSSLASLATSIDTAVSFPYTGLSANDFEVLESYASHGYGSGDFSQTTPYTCGAMVALAVDRVRGGHDPRDLVAAHYDKASLAKHEAQMFDRMHRGSHWPRMWGTTPWMLAREFSTSQITYQTFALNDRRESTWNALQWAFHAACAGQASALYTGGSLNSHRSLSAAVPRHIIGVLPGENYTANGLPQLQIYEPAAGKIFHVPLHIMMERRTRLRALGRWSHVVWAVLPGKNNF